VATRGGEGCQPRPQRCDIVRVDVPIRPDMRLLETCCVACVDVPIRPARVFLVELCSARVDDPIQPAGVVFVCFFLLSWLWSLRAISLYFFCYINRNTLVEYCSFKKKLVRFSCTEMHRVETPERYVDEEKKWNSRSRNIALFSSFGI